MPNFDLFSPGDSLAARKLNQAPDAIQSSGASLVQQLDRPAALSSTFDVYHVTINGFSPAVPPADVDVNRHFLANLPDENDPSLLVEQRVMIPEPLWFWPAAPAYIIGDQVLVARMAEGYEYYLGVNPEETKYKVRWVDLNVDARRGVQV